MRDPAQGAPPSVPAPGSQSPREEVEDVPLGGPSRRRGPRPGFPRGGPEPSRAQLPRGRAETPKDQNQAFPPRVYSATVKISVNLVFASPEPISLMFRRDPRVKLGCLSRAGLRRLPAGSKAYGPNSLPDANPHARRRQTSDTSRCGGIPPSVQPGSRAERGVRWGWGAPFSRPRKSRGKRHLQLFREPQTCTVRVASPVSRTHSRPLVRVGGACDGPPRVSPRMVRGRGSRGDTRLARPLTRPPAGGWSYRPAAPCDHLRRRGAISSS